MQIVRALCVGALVYAATANGASAQTTAADQSTSAPNASGDLFQSAPAARKNVKFVRAVLRIPSEESVGAIYTDMLCLTNGSPIYVKHSGDMPTGEYAQMFSEAYSKGDDQGAAGDSLFDGSASNGREAELLVAAAITAIKIRACRVPDPFAREKVQATASATVEWQVMDALERKIVFRATTEAHASVTDSYRIISGAALHAAFANAAQQLVNLPEFQAITIAAPSNASADLPAASAPTVIPKVPLSSTPLTRKLEDIKAHVVTVITPSGSGSGFYVADGMLLTNHHVAAQGTDVKIRFLSGREIPGRSVVSNARRDIALIKTDPIGISGLPLHLDSPDVASKVYVLGSPGVQHVSGEFEGTLTTGIVSAVREFDHKPFIQSDVGVTHGNSGGPMFDENGNVIGITDLGFETTAINLFIPIADALKPLGIVVDTAIQPTASAKHATKHAAAH